MVGNATIYNWSDVLFLDWRTHLLWRYRSREFPYQFGTIVLSQLLEFGYAERYAYIALWERIGISVYGGRNLCGVPQYGFLFGNRPSRTIVLHRPF
jgi:hypothetical protein